MNLTIFEKNAIETEVKRATPNDYAAISSVIKIGTGTVTIFVR